MEAQWRSSVGIWSVGSFTFPMSQDWRRWKLHMRHTSRRQTDYPPFSNKVYSSLLCHRNWEILSLQCYGDEALSLLIQLPPTYPSMGPATQEAPSQAVAQLPIESLISSLQWVGVACAGSCDLTSRVDSNR